MAKPIAFVPKSTAPQLELQHRLDAAPQQHAEAILAAYNLLEEAHRKGGGKDFEELLRASLQILAGSVAQKSARAARADA